MFLDHYSYIFPNFREMKHVGSDIDQNIPYFKEKSKH